MRVGSCNAKYPRVEVGAEVGGVSAVRRISDAGGSGSPSDMDVHISATAMRRPYARTGGSSQSIANATPITVVLNSSSTRRRMSRSTHSVSSSCSVAMRAPTKLGRVSAQ